MKGYLSDRFHGADVGVWTEQDVLQLGLLLVHPFHGYLLGTVLLAALTLATLAPAVGLLFFGGIVLFKEGLLLDTCAQLLLKNTKGEFLNSVAVDKQSYQQD